MIFVLPILTIILIKYKAKYKTVFCLFVFLYTREHQDMKKEFQHNAFPFLNPAVHTSLLAEH